MVAFFCPRLLTNLSPGTGTVVGYGRCHRGRRPEGRTNELCTRRPLRREWTESRDRWVAGYPPQCANTACIG